MRGAIFAEISTSWPAATSLFIRTTSVLWWRLAPPSDVCLKLVTVRAFNACPLSDWRNLCNFVWFSFYLIFDVLFWILGISWNAVGSFWKKFIYEFSNDRKFKMALILILFCWSMSVDFIFTHWLIANNNIERISYKIITTNLKYVILFFTRYLKFKIWFRRNQGKNQICNTNMFK